MASKPKPAPVALPLVAPAPGAPTTGYSFVRTAAPAALVRQFGGEKSETSLILEALALPENAPTSAGDVPAHFFPIVPVAATIVDPAEIAKARKEHVRKLTTSLSSAIRRAIGDAENVKIIYRRVEGNEADASGAPLYGVRVYRVDGFTHA